MAAGTLNYCKGIEDLFESAVDKHNLNIKRHPQLNPIEARKEQLMAR